MPILLLIRHGENEFVKTGRLAGRLSNVHLNENGIKQSQLLANSLAVAPIKAVYSSPMDRAKETATPLALLFGLEVLIRPGLIETEVGEWSGQELKNLKKLPLWKSVQERPSRFRFPNGESFVECQNRLVGEVEVISKNHSDNEIVAIFSHADPIKLLLTYYLGMSIDHFQRLGCETASVSILSLSQKSVMILKINQTAPFSFPLSQTSKKIKPKSEYKSTKT